MATPYTNPLSTLATDPVRNFRFLVTFSQLDGGKTGTWGSGNWFGGIAYNINVKYKDFVKSILTAKDPAVKKLLKMRLQTFIKELKVFTEAPLESYLDLEELPLPRYTQTLEEFLRTINQDKKLWNKFKQKVSRLYEKLKIQADRLIRKG